MWVRRKTRESQFARTCDSSSTSNKRTTANGVYERTSDPVTRFVSLSHFRKLTTWLRAHLDHEARWRGCETQQATPWTEFGGSRSYTRSAIDSQPGAAWGASTIRNVETSSSWARYVGHPCLSKTISLLPSLPFFHCSALLFSALVSNRIANFTESRGNFFSPIIRFISFPMCATVLGFELVLEEQSVAVINGL